MGASLSALTSYLNMMGPASENTVYYGTFVHSKADGGLETIKSGAIGVDAAGKIAWVEREVDDVESCKKKQGWDSAAVVRLPGEGFFFPGFIGMISSAFCEDVIV